MKKAKAPRPARLKLLPFRPPDPDPAVVEVGGAARMFEVEVPPSPVGTTLQIRIEGPAATVNLITLRVSDITRPERRP